MASAPATYFFLLITLVTSIYALVVDRSLLEKFILSPYAVVQHRQYYRIFSATLIHNDWMHLLFNLFTFYSFGPYLEQYYLHSWGMVVLYLGGTLISHLPTVWRYRKDASYLSLGASGAISAVVFSFILFNPTAQLGVFFLIPMPAWVFALLYMGFSYYADRQGLGRINHGAHLWGALAGLGITALLQPSSVKHFAQFVAQLLG